MLAVVVALAAAGWRRLNPFVKFIAGSMAKNQSDHRDWDAIRAWAEGLRPKLLPEMSVHPAL